MSLRDQRCTVALDGERELEMPRPGHQLEVALNPRGPQVVDMAAALQSGAEGGAFLARPARI